MRAILIQATRPALLCLASGTFKYNMKNGILFNLEF